MAIVSCDFYWFVPFAVSSALSTVVIDSTKSVSGMSSTGRPHDAKCSSDTWSQLFA